MRFGHVGPRQRVFELRVREHEVYLPQLEKLISTQCRNVSVEVEPISATDRKRPAIFAQDVGGWDRCRVFFQRAIKGDDFGRRLRTIAGAGATGQKPLRIIFYRDGVSDRRAVLSSSTA